MHYQKAGGGGGGHVPLEFCQPPPITWYQHRKVTRTVHNIPKVGLGCSVMKRGGWLKVGWLVCLLHEGVGGVRRQGQLGWGGVGGKPMA